ncbi:FlgD immunoglobulin-like domain containing protein [Actinoplanes sp. OR16]|uniref:FlgD immunoglobulin-like domain containing protein n=1 Tax=Actinoplanes sp. OR16 TaxID=946334 RepID=UPI000FD7DF26|nr:FlgD immunoglobulin-like domain containing protein [Actinoplanes sp. OR16]
MDARSFGWEADYGITGSTVVAAEPAPGGSGKFRGQALYAVTEPQDTKIMDPAGGHVVTTPDGSLLVAGAEEYVEQGDLDWGIYRLTEGADGSIVRDRITAVAAAPAQVYGLALGNGILTTATNSTVHEPTAVIGAYRSYWLDAGPTPKVVRSTLDQLASIDEVDSGCEPSKIHCLRLFADGTGYHGTTRSTYDSRTALHANGTTVYGGRSVKSNIFSPMLADLSGRYGIVADGEHRVQDIADFWSGTVLGPRDGVAAAVWGSTLWTGAEAGGIVQATTLPGTTVIERFTTHNGCTPSALQAVGRWVYYACIDSFGWFRGSGVYDRVTKRIAPGAPIDEVLLGDGYLVEQVVGVGLRLTDLHNGVPFGASWADLPTRVLVTAAEMGPWANDGTGYGGRRDIWTVDRFGGGVAYADSSQRVHVVPTGIPAPPITVIDSKVATTAANWTGTWWLSKPAKSWQVTIKSTAGTTLRTISGSTANGLIEVTWDGKNAAGVPVAGNAFTWALTAQPADGQGAALATGNAPAPLTATTTPAIAGTTAVGVTVKATTGSWRPAPTSYAYQWYANGVAIKGATGSSYPIPASLLGKRLTVAVTAKRAGHPTGVAKSAASAAIAAGAAPKATKAPVISGTVAVGSAVKASTGTWSPTPSCYAYQWSANGVAIKGATGSSYAIPASLLGKRLTVTVTAKRAGHTNGVAKSAASGAVAKGKAPKATKKPQVTGTAKVGRKVKASAGTWSPTATSYRYEWRLNGKLIKGASAATLKLKSSMRGKKLTVTVIAKRTGHSDGRSTSASVKIR